MIDVQEFINERPLKGLGVLVLICCFLVTTMDGFDISVIGYIASVLREQWDLSPAQLLLLFVSGLVGLMAGAFVCRPMADGIGRKAVLIVTVVWFGAASILSTSATTRMRSARTNWRPRYGTLSRSRAPCRAAEPTPEFRNQGDTE